MLIKPKNMDPKIGPRTVRKLILPMNGKRGIKLTFCKLFRYTPMRL